MSLVLATRSNGPLPIDTQTHTHKTCTHNLWQPATPMLFTKSNWSLVQFLALPGFLPFIWVNSWGSRLVWEIRISSGLTILGHPTGLGEPRRCLPWRGGNVMVSPITPYIMPAGVLTWVLWPLAQLGVWLIAGSQCLTLPKRGWRSWDLDAGV